jgi:hypothetical protein
MAPHSLIWASLRRCADPQLGEVGTDRLVCDKQTRRHFMPHKKVAIVMRHLLEGVPVSNLCDEFDILIALPSLLQ